MSETSNVMDIVKSYDIIIVEGYDGVGKSTFLRGISDQVGGKVYRPDYNYWESMNLPKNLRWMIGASIFDFLKIPTVRLNTPIFIDRGILSGMVYTSPSVGRGYRDLIQKSGRSVLHLIVNTDEESYEEFCKLRDSETPSAPYQVVLEKTRLFREYALLLGVDHILISNAYNKEYADKVVGKCGSCGHFGHGGYCSLKDMFVPIDSPRCEESRQREVQDKNES